MFYVSRRARLLAPVRTTSQWCGVKDFSDPKHRKKKNDTQQSLLARRESRASTHEFHQRNGLFPLVPNDCSRKQTHTHKSHSKHRTRFFFFLLLLLHLAHTSSSTLLIRTTTNHRSSIINCTFSDRGSCRRLRFCSAATAIKPPFGPLVACCCCCCALLTSRSHRRKESFFFLSSFISIIFCYLLVHTA